MAQSRNQTAKLELDKTQLTQSTISPCRHMLDNTNTIKDIQRSAYIMLIILILKQKVVETN